MVALLKKLLQVFTLVGQFDHFVMPCRINDSLHTILIYPIVLVYELVIVMHCLHFPLHSTTVITKVESGDIIHPKLHWVLVMVWGKSSFLNVYTLAKDFCCIVSERNIYFIFVDCWQIVNIWEIKAPFWRINDRHVR